MASFGRKKKDSKAKAWTAEDHITALTDCIQELCQRKEQHWICNVFFQSWKLLLMQNNIAASSFHCEFERASWYATKIFIGKGNTKNDIMLSPRRESFHLKLAILLEKGGWYFCKMCLHSECTTTVFFFFFFLVGKNMSLAGFQMLL